MSYVLCAFCEKSSLDEDSSIRLVPLSLRHRAFAHGPCTRKYCQLPCEWCAMAPVDVGQRVVGTRLLWQGQYQDFPAEVVGKDAASGTMTLCFADVAELERVSSNPDWQNLIRCSEDIQTKSRPSTKSSSAGAAGASASSRGAAGAGATRAGAAGSVQKLVDPAATLYDHGLMLAYGLKGLPVDKPKAVMLWRLASEKGHPSASLGVAVPACQVQAVCAFHCSPEVKDWWRILPPRFLVSSLDVRPEVTKLALYIWLYVCVIAWTPSLALSPSPSFLAYLIS